MRKKAQTKDFFQIYLCKNKNPDLNIVKILLEQPDNCYAVDKNNLVLLFFILYNSEIFSIQQKNVAKFLLDAGYIHDLNEQPVISNFHKYFKIASKHFMVG